MKNLVKYKVYGGRTVKARKSAHPMGFLLLEYSSPRKIEWEFTVDELVDPTTIKHYMIIGASLLVKMALEMQFNEVSINRMFRCPSLEEIRLLSDENSCDFSCILTTEVPILK